jgi:hypothetical protein
VPDAANWPQLAEYRRQFLARLESQPRGFAALIASLVEPEWHARRAPDGLSLHQLLVHVRDAEALAYWPRIQRILAEDAPHLDPFPKHRWSLEEHYLHTEPLAEVLGTLTRTRAEVVAALTTLAPAAWSRLGFHPPSGPRTVQWWAERLYLHAHNHLEELHAAVDRPPARPDPYAGEPG